MCSIAGFVSNKPITGWAADRLITALLYYGAERGDQSAGVYVNGKVCKKAIDPYALACDDEYLKLVEKPTQLALVHTRFPTCGGEDDPQAQPFEVDGTVSIHNGWFSNMHELKRIFNIKKPTGVDSELVTQFVHSYGINKLPQFLKCTYGCSACAVLYKEELYLIRSGNPTNYTIVDLSDGNSIFIFASTGRILRDAVRYAWLLPAEHPIHETKEGVLLRVSPEGLTTISEKIRTKTPSWVYSYDDHYFTHDIADNYEDGKTDWEDDLTIKYPESPYYRPRKVTDDADELLATIEREGKYGRDSNSSKA